MAADRRHKHSFRSKYTEAGVQWWHNMIGTIPETKHEERWVKGELTSNVLQRDGNTRRHLPRSSKSPVAELLVRANAWATSTKWHLACECAGTLKRLPILHTHFGYSSVLHAGLATISGIFRLRTNLRHQMTSAVDGWNTRRGRPPQSEVFWNKCTIVGDAQWKTRFIYLFSDVVDHR